MPSVFVPYLRLRPRNDYPNPPPSSCEAEPVKKNKMITIKPTVIPKSRSKFTLYRLCPIQRIRLTPSRLRGDILSRYRYGRSIFGNYRCPHAGREKMKPMSLKGAGPTGCTRLHRSNIRKTRGERWALRELPVG